MTNLEFESMTEKCLEYQRLTNELENLRRFIILFKKGTDSGRTAQLAIETEGPYLHTLEIPIEVDSQVIQFLQWYEDMLTDKIEQL